MAHVSLKDSSQSQSTRKNIMRKTIEVGTSTFLSRILGLMREMFMVRFLGTSALADAFFTAFKIPNSLRKIFAEGALSVAFIPTFVKLLKNESKKEVSQLMTLSFLVIEGLLVALCGLIFWKADLVIRFIAPGWYPGQPSLNVSALSSTQFFDNLIHHPLATITAWIAPAWFVTAPGLEQTLYAAQFLRILISFILFLSCSALLASALQSVNHFFVTAFSPIALNIVFIAGLLSCIYFKLSVTTLCYFILAGGIIQFLLHIYVYIKLNFGFFMFNSQIKSYFYEILGKFLPCLFAMSILEVNLFVSTTLATYLPTGSIALIYYANRFMGIPLGIFSTAFSTILLPYFARIGVYAPKRLSIYLLEATKFIFWITIPATIIMSFLAKQIFITLFLSEKFTIADVNQASTILIVFATGLFIFSLNKILLNIFYALHDTLMPTLISIAISVCNYSLCKLFIGTLGVTGLALGFVLSSLMQTILFLGVLPVKFNISLFIKPFCTFAMRCVLQMMLFLPLFFMGYYASITLVHYTMPTTLATFLLEGIGFWMWLLPLLGLLFIGLLKTRRLFGIKLLFIEHE